MRSSWLLALATWCLCASALARPDRPNQVPNGTVHGCSTCHLLPEGGGPRNEFGAAIEQQFLRQDGTVDWGPALAALDSDQDGRSNGEELQDPSGSWRRGLPQPGNPALVTRPGLAEPRVPALNTWSRSLLALALALAVRRARA